MNLIENHQLVKDILLKNKVLKPIESVFDHWMLGKHKNDVVLGCHVFIDGMVEEKIDPAETFPILVFSPYEVSTDYVLHSEVKELNEKNIAPDTTLVSLYDFIRHFSH